MTLRSMRDLLNDEAIPIVKAHVALHEGEQDYWFINDEGHLHVSVITSRGQQINALYCQNTDSDGIGFWKLPELGAEVVIGFDNGDIECDPYLIGILSKSYTVLPEDFGAPGWLFIQGNQVLIRDNVGGAAVPLATKADLQALVDWVNAQFDPVTGHTHKAIIPAQPTNIVRAPAAPGTAPDPNGTSILLGQ